MSQLAFPRRAFLLKLSNLVRQNKAIFEILFLLIVALIFRIWVVTSIIGFNQSGLSSDDREFEGIGWTLVEAGRYAISPDSPPTARREPGLPFLVAGIYALVGHQKAVAQSVLLFISALTAPLTWLVGKKVAGRRVGILAGLWTALDPFAWIYAGLFYSETLFIFLFIWGVLLILGMVKSPKYHNLVMLGVVLGLGALTRANGLGVALGGVALLPIIGPGKSTDWFKRAAGVFAVVILLLIPWIGRNYLVFNRFIPTTSQTGEVLLGFYNEKCLKQFCVEWIRVYSWPDYAYLLDLDEITRDDVQMALVRATLQAHPQAWLGLLPGKLIYFWSHDMIMPNTPFRSAPSLIFFMYQRVYYRILLIVGLAGLFTLYFTRRRQAFIILTSFVAIYSLMVLVFWGNARLRMPLHPLLAVAMAYALAAAYDKLLHNVSERDKQQEIVAHSTGAGITR